MATYRKGDPLRFTFCQTVTDPGVYGDGYGSRGLALRVTVGKHGSVSRYWIQRIRINGKRRNLGLGAYPALSLREARLKAEANYREAKAGRDPRASATTLAEAMDSVISLQRGGWKNGATEKQWRGSFGNYVLPALGTRKVADITTEDLLAVLEPIWFKVPTQARGIRRRLGQVFDWVKATKIRQDNPADALGSLLGNNQKATTYTEALPHGEVAEALAKVAGSRAGAATKLVARFLVLTATRTTEARLASWSEIEGDIWTIPADRMKAGREHRIPLSAAALEVLADARKQWGSEGLIFPGRSGKPLGHASLGTLFKRLEISAPPHGMRTSFRSWCAESGVAREVAERALAHVVQGVEGAYNRTDLLEARREVMEAWGEYLAT